MACVEIKAPIKVDSEMEEGEIVDDLSDISSEEEFLLRQRLEVLEDYNNALERKKAKRSSTGPGTKQKKEDDALSPELSEISATELEDYCPPHKNLKVQKHQKTHHRQKRKKEATNGISMKSKDHKKKNNHSKKKVELIICSSEESEDEYRSRRQKLAEAVVVNSTKNDKTSLSERLQKMLCGVNPEPTKLDPTESKIDAKNINNEIPTQGELGQLDNCSPISTQNDLILNAEVKDAIDTKDTCSEDGKTVITVNSEKSVPVNLIIKDIVEDRDIQKILDRSDKDSDDDLELLRQHALKTKTVKTGTKTVKKENLSLASRKRLLEDEDSDTAELRMICLRSALLKKAIEMKRKQKLQKRLSQSSNIQDDNLDEALMRDKENSDNNTDTESVDMDIGSDVDDKLKENEGDGIKNSINEQHAMEVTETGQKDIPVLMVTKEDELEDDEDLLRAKLLTSLSKNLPNLVNPNIIIDPNKNEKDAESITPTQTPLSVPEEKRFIIKVDSDSEGEHEATKNLTKMHMKLSEQRIPEDFQQRLDVFLKNTRMEVEKTTHPDVVQQQVTPMKTEKYVVKAVKHLPKSEQIEYKNLVKRMAELEKIKQARQSSMNLNKVPVALKETLKPRNITIATTNLSDICNLEEKIRNSRKNIAEESAKMLKLKEEGTKLTQKFKIVATELRNIKTAIALNKKQQRSVQNCLTKIRLHHQMLLKSSMSSTSTHSKVNTMSHGINRSLRLQKENNPKEDKNVVVKENPKDTHINPPMPKAPKSATNDLKKTETKPKPLVIQHPRLSIELDVANNKKVITIPNGDEEPDKSKEEQRKSGDLLESSRHSSHPVVEKGGGINDVPHRPKRRGSDDYKSPLDAFGSTTWEGDPNAILCPFEVCGDCKDAACKYLHTKTRSK